MREVAARCSHARVHIRVALCSVEVLFLLDVLFKLLRCLLLLEVDLLLQNLQVFRDEDASPLAACFWLCDEDHRRFVV